MKRPLSPSKRPAARKHPFGVTNNSDCGVRREWIILQCMSGLLLPLLVVAAAAAADSASVPAAVTLDEVSVTAIKGGAGSTALKPVAATVVGENEIERLGIVTMKDVSELAPNFYIPDYGSRMTSSIYVRGIGARIDQPSVGLNVDNVPFLNKDNYDFDLVDIERIEVMRGPQSTLYGRNTMAGTINVTTLSPLRWQGVRVMAEGGTGGTARAAAGFYGKLHPRLGMALTADFHYQNGFFKNSYNGARADREEGGSLRWKTAWRPAAATMVENTASLTLSRQHGYPYAYVETGRIAYNDTCFYKRTGITDGLTVKWTGGRVSVSSITSFQYIDDNMTLDQDFLPDSYFTLTQKRREWGLTQDVVAQGTAGRYTWLGGFFGFYKRGTMDAPVTFKEDGIERLIIAHRNEMNADYPVSWDSDRFPLLSYFTIPVGGFAAYHRSSLELGAWTLAADLRLDIEHTRLDERSVCDASYTIHDLTGAEPTVFGTERVEIDNAGTLSHTYVQLLPKLTVTRRLDLPESIIYASASKGYKAGGYNTQMFSDVLQQQVMASMGVTSKYDVGEIVSYKPEQSWNFEVGVHLSTPSRRLTADVAVFWIECRDQQLTMFPDGVTTGRIMANAGRTRSLGAELSASWLIGGGLSLKGAWGYTNATFRRFNNGMTDYSGKRVPYAPSNTLFLGATWAKRFAPGSLIEGIEANINARGLGDIYWDEANTHRQPFYMLAGASVRLSRGVWSVDLWGENLTATRFNTFSYVSVGNTFLQRGKPCRGGITLRLTFANT